MKISAVILNSGRAPVFRSKTSEKKSNSDLKQDYKNFVMPVGIAMATLAITFGSYQIIKSKPSAYVKTLAESMGSAKNRTINPKNLSPIASSEELLGMLSKLENKNYVFNPENLKNGVFRADLHSHSIHSDGDGFVKNLLDDAAEYADKLYSKTRQKFVFALTDHDTVSGLKEALDIIEANPQKYKNLRFVPGVEVSFAHKVHNSSNTCEMSELLVYGVNPYSDKVNKFLDGIRQKRIDMVHNYFAELAEKYPQTKFSFDEFVKFYEFKKYGNVMNIHWRAYHYAQTKHAITQHANKFGKNPEEYYSKIMTDKQNPSVGYLKETVNELQKICEDAEITKIFQKYKPHFENGKLIASSENTFEEIISAFKDEPNIFMAFSHPCWYARTVQNPIEGLKYYVEHSNGLIKASESFHQVYKNPVTDDFISKIQQATENLNLLNLGGRDNHGTRLFIR